MSSHAPAFSGVLGLHALASARAESMATGPGQSSAISARSAA